MVTQGYPVSGRRVVEDVGTMALQGVLPWLLAVVPWKNKKTVSGSSNKVASLSQRVPTAFVKIA